MANDAELGLHRASVEALIKIDPSDPRRQEIERLAHLAGNDTISARPPISPAAIEIPGNKPEATLASVAVAEGISEVAVAKKILGSDFLGPQEIVKTFDGVRISQDQIVQLLAPLTIERLVQEKRLGHFLIVRASETADGTPITEQWILEQLQGRFQRERKGKILYNTDWYQNEAFFTDETPRFGLAFVSKGVIRGSTSRDYLGQTEALANYLRSQIFKVEVLPANYQEAISQFEGEKEELRRLLTGDWRQAAQRLSELYLNQLMRRNHPELVYDLVVYLQNNNRRLLRDRWDWTTSRSSYGSLVDGGSFDAYGTDVYCWRPDSSGLSHPYLGVCASRLV